ncbi:MAG: hypothetical protein RL095_696 [Verrucomicrobiota bacterium]|jgi:hypothetical protein
MKSLLISCLISLSMCPFALAGTESESAASVQAASKPGAKWRPQPTRVLAHLPPLPENPPLGRFGGLAGDKLQATGFFRTAKIKDRWWLVDPEGGRFYNIGIATVHPYVSEATQPIFDRKFGSSEAWAVAASSQLRELGFNGLGAWSSLKPLNGVKSRVPYTKLLGFMIDYAKSRGAQYTRPGMELTLQDCFFVFDPGFEKFCEERAKTLAELKDDPWLIGYFSDNELPFFRLPYFRDLLDKCLALPPEDATGKAARQWFSARKQAAPRDEDRMAFLGAAADRYYSVTTRAIRKYDPNHLCLGSRFWATDLDRPELWTAAGKYLDVVSVNYYHAWTPQPERLEMWQKSSGKPFLVSEFYAKGEDSGLPNTQGAGWLVRTQRDRGLFYQNFTLGLLECPGCVGWHWFRYMDNDPAKPGRNLADHDSNKGIVSIRYEAYEPLTEMMRQINRRVHPLAARFDEERQARKP